MGFRVEYQPSAAASGAVAQTAGRGFHQQYRDQFALGQEELLQRERLSQFEQQQANARLQAELQAQLQQESMRNYANRLDSVTRAAQAQQQMALEAWNQERGRQFDFYADRAKQMREAQLQARLTQQKYRLAGLQDERDFVQERRLQDERIQASERLRQLDNQSAMDRLVQDAEFRRGNLFTESALGMINQMRETNDWSEEDRGRMSSIARQLQSTRQRLSDGYLTPQQYQQIEQRFMGELSTMIPTQPKSARAEWDKRAVPMPEYGMLGWMQPDGDFEVRPLKNADSEAQAAQMKMVNDLAAKQFDAELDAYKAEMSLWSQFREGPRPLLPSFGQIRQRVLLELQPEETYPADFTGPLPPNARYEQAASQVAVSQPMGSPGSAFAGAADSGSALGAGGAMSAPAPVHRTPGAMSQGNPGGFVNSPEYRDFSELNATLSSQYPQITAPINRLRDFYRRYGTDKSQWLAAGASEQEVKTAMKDAWTIRYLVQHARTHGGL